jgi:hypothetical protein
MHQNANHHKMFISIAFVLLIALVLCVSLGAMPSSPQATGLEYKVISRVYLTTEMLNREELKYPDARARAIETTLNNLAKKGWELQDSSESFFILKRALK